jgi:CheY-like chemotaxis protein
VEEEGTVLLVGEDDAFGMYSEFLRMQGLSASVSRSPGDAILAIPEAPPDVVVTELAFGGHTRTGCQFISAVRQEPATKDTVILVVSGSVRSKHRQLARQCGADRYFPKPLSPSALLEEVLEAIRFRREQRRPPWNAPLPTGDRHRHRRPRRS